MTLAHDSPTADAGPSGEHRIGLHRLFTSPGIDPFDEVVWELGDARITNFRDGTVAFEQLGVEFPATWSQNARNIVAQKYFRGTLGTPEREWSLKQVVGRIVGTITQWGREGGYFADATEAEAFAAELAYTLITQRAAFNSPVWFNIGVAGVPQQASACFILDVDDTMDSILNWYREEGIIFKGGSGAGVNLSKIRSSKEHLKGGGTASGPVSFMRGADASAGTIKSGGKTRRAAKMAILNADHPDIAEFVWCKAIEERKARVLRDAGFNMDLDGSDAFSVQYQNANNSVRVTDEFMQAVVDDADWPLRAVITGDTVETVKARDLWRQIAEAAWECADPGLQFDTTINTWHTAATTGRIDASNPCSEYVHLNNSACNLASLNLLKFLDEDGSFDVDAFRHAVEIVFTAQEILVGRADYPTDKIGDNARAFRQLGLGYANLGAMLMALGLPYDSDEGRAWAAAVTSLMTGHAYATSARTAARLGPFDGYAENHEHMLRVLDMHRDAAYKIANTGTIAVELLEAGQRAWESALNTAATHGVRNSQATVLAPTGCLVGGTFVATDRGLVRLRSLGAPDGPEWQPIDVTVATDGGPRTATRFFVNGLERVVNVTTSRGYAISGTARHRIKVVDTEGEWVWRRFADLRPGERVPLALGSMVGEPRVVRLPPASEHMAWAAEVHFDPPRTMTAQLAELVGYFMGDGSLHAKGLRFCVTCGGDDVIEVLRLAGKELFGLEAHVVARQGYTSIEFNSVRLSDWWEASGLAKFRPDGHVGKGLVPRVPDAVLHTNDADVYRAFLRGLYEADGTTTQGYPSWTTAKAGFADEVQALLLALGFVTTRTHGVSGRGSELTVLRLLNRAANQRWADEIGFISSRKSRAVDLSESQQAARYDHIPVSRALIDRVAPTNDRNRRVALLTHARTRTITRRLGDELFDATGDSELGHLLGFFYDEIMSAELGEEELTYDLSVPANVTYVANGFVSHNTIGLAMDCDTTGIEPDLGLVKSKKLVGGGTMAIVNQTIPRALTRLGYSPEQVTEIVDYVHEHHSAIGAPHLAAEHLPVFACSMGDNTIHYEGHVRMMGAVQPFISGAISKTVNVPEDVTVDDVAGLHMFAWEQGLKAVAIYRDNCKVGQPLSTGKRAGPANPAPADELVTVIEGVTERVIERVVHKPVRQKLPRTRSSRTFEFRVADCKGFLTIGEYATGQPGEIFLTVSKQGSTLAGIMDAFAKSVSYGLQYGVPLRAYIEAFVNMKFEPAGMTDDPDVRFAGSVMDYLFRRLALEYLSYDERAELGIFTVAERTQPTLPGVEEAVTASTSTDSAPGPARATGEVRAPDAPLCMQCGIAMIRAGSCHACPSCGSTSGCS